MAKVARTFKVDITSDTVCPFCLLGITQFETALAKWKNANPDKPVTLDARLLPFQLRPNMSEEPVDLMQWYAANMGGPERSKAMRERMAQSYKAVGLDLTKSAKVANTNKAHRLETLAQTKGDAVNYAVGKDLMKAYQVDGIAPNDPDMLAKVALDNGLFESTEQAKAWIASDALNEETQAGYRKARNQGITGVPFFVFDDKFAASGAVGVEEFYGMIDRIMDA